MSLTDLPARRRRNDKDGRRPLNGSRIIMVTSCIDQAEERVAYKEGLDG